MVTDAREPRRNYPIPDEANFVSQDFPRLRDAVRAIGADAADALDAVAGKAPAVHNHTIAQVTGLQAVLDSKLSSLPPINLDDLADVNVSGAAQLMVLMKVGAQWVPGVVSFANLNNVPTQFPPSPHNHDASHTTSGVFDPARIPLMYSGIQEVSSGGIANLTAGQQANINRGAVVTTTDGRRWIYSGAGSKTSEASYIEMADVTPEWAVIANKPWNVVNLQALLDAKASLGANVNFRDVTANRGDGTGAVFFAGAYLYYDGVNWQLSGGSGVYHNGNMVHTNGNYWPVTDMRLAGWFGHDAWAAGSPSWSPDVGGGVVTQLRFQNYGQAMGVTHINGKYVQKAVGGTWYTIANA